MVKVLVDVLKSKEGIFSTIMIVGGIVLMRILQVKGAAPAIMMIGSLISICGTQALVRQLAAEVNAYNQQHKE